MIVEKGIGMVITDIIVITIKPMTTANYQPDLPPENKVLTIAGVIVIGIMILMYVIIWLN